MHRQLMLLLCALFAASPASAETPKCTGTTKQNRQIITEFFQLGLVERQPRAAFEKYAAPDFIEHKADVPEGTRGAVVRYLEGLIRQVPDPRWEMLRTVAEGDMVFVHARFTPARGAPAYAVADLFRLKNCRIVEHWDVVAGPPDRQLNPNSRF